MTSAASPLRIYPGKIHQAVLVNSISIIGSGKIGAAVGIGFEQLGNKVIFCDTGENRIEYLKKLGHRITSDLKHAINDSSLTFICVPTPSQGSIDLSHVISAVTGIADALRNKPDYHLVVIKSTVLPTTTERTVIPLLANSGKKLGEELGLCVNPEFLTESAITWTDDNHYRRDFFSEDRIVIGE